MLNGKTVVVTGAAKGIGKAVALAFAKKGCNIVLNYHSTLPDDVVSEIEACGVKCLPVKGDVADNAQAVGHETELVGIAEMPVDVHLLYGRIRGGM